MWARKRIDIGWTDLLAGCWAAMLPGDVSSIQGTLMARGQIPDSSLVCLSARTGFDLLLSALALPPDSEVVFSAITIPDMPRIARLHRLKVVAADLDPGTMLPTVEGLRAVLTASTRMVVVASLFGTQSKLSELATVCREHGIWLVEDRAQAFVQSGETGDSDADVQLWSFGPIKTATALGGGLVRVNHPSILEAMQGIQATYPIAGRPAFARRLLKYMCLKLASQPRAYGLVVKLGWLMGRDPDQVVGGLARNFSGADLVSYLRRRPAAPLQRLMQRRLSQDHGSRVHRRAECGNQMAVALAPTLRSQLSGLPGSQANSHTYWVFAVEASEPVHLVASLRRRGFDATHFSSLRVVEGTDASEAAGCPQATALLQRLVFLPDLEQLPQAEFERLIHILVGSEDLRGEPHLSLPISH